MKLKCQHSECNAGHPPHHNILVIKPLYFHTWNLMDFRKYYCWSHFIVVMFMFNLKTCDGQKLSVLLPTQFWMQHTVDSSCTVGTTTNLLNNLEHNLFVKYEESMREIDESHSHRSLFIIKVMIKKKTSKCPEPTTGLNLVPALKAPEVCMFFLVSQTGSFATTEMPVLDCFACGLGGRVPNLPVIYCILCPDKIVRPKWINSRQIAKKSILWISSLNV